MDYTTLITFVAEYFVEIFVNLCLYVKYTYYGCYVFPCSLGFCIVIVIVSLMKIEKNHSHTRLIEIAFDSMTLVPTFLRHQVQNGTR